VWPHGNDNYNFNVFIYITTQARYSASVAFLGFYSPFPQT